MKRNGMVHSIRLEQKTSGQRPRRNKWCIAWLEGWIHRNMNSALDMEAINDVSSIFPPEPQTISGSLVNWRMREDSGKKVNLVGIYFYVTRIRDPLLIPPRPRPIEFSLLCWVSFLYTYIMILLVYPLSTGRKGLAWRKAVPFDSMVIVFAVYNKLNVHYIYSSKESEIGGQLLWSQVTAFYS